MHVRRRLSSARLLSLARTINRPPALSAPSRVRRHIASPRSASSSCRGCIYGCFTHHGHCERGETVAQVRPGARPSEQACMRALCGVVWGTLFGQCRAAKGSSPAALQPPPTAAACRRRRRLQALPHEAAAPVRHSSHASQEAQAHAAHAALLPHPVWPPRALQGVGSEDWQRRDIRPGAAAAALQHTLPPTTQPRMH